MAHAAWPCQALGAMAKRSAAMYYVPIRLMNASYATPWNDSESRRTPCVLYTRPITSAMVYDPARCETIQAAARNAPEAKVVREWAV